MKRFYGLSACLLLVGCASNDAPTPPVNEKPKEEKPITACKTKGYELPSDITDYELVWSDEFDVDGLPDETKWGYDTGGHGWGNNELQYYTAGDNVAVENGMLVIEARQEEHEGMDYTSTRLISKDKGDFLYGKFEIKAKLPKGLGTWPAIWMLPTDWKYGNWPISGEIDIMEHVGYDHGVVHGSVHTNRYNHKKKTQKTAQIRDMLDVSEEFHVYGLEWLPNKIIVSMDGEEYFTFEPGKFLDCPSKEEWPFDQDFHLLLNLAVGGDWGGAQGVSEDIWPQKMEVDYVRVYQSKTVLESVEERGK